MPFYDFSNNYRKSVKIKVNENFESKSGKKINYTEDAKNINFA